MTEPNAIFAPDAFAAGTSGPLYLRLKALIQGAIQDGSLGANDALPSEREIASMLDISRVTVRKALAELVEDGVLTQKRGSGTFVTEGSQRVEQRLSRLTSFTEDMLARGLTPSVKWLQKIVAAPSPEEAMVLGDRVALLRHGRIAQIGTAAEIYRQPIDLNAARFFSPLSEIDSTVSSGRAATPLGSVPTPGLAEGAAVTIAIRPAGGASMAISGPGTPGRVVSKRDAIGIDICEVMVDGLDAPLGLRLPSNAAMGVGQDVFVTLNPEHVLVFARD